MSGIDFTNDFEALKTMIGISASYSSSTITGVFINEYQATEMFGHGIENRNPIFIVNASDVSEIKNGDTIIINAVEYIVSEVKPNGVGQIILELRRK